MHLLRLKAKYTYEKLCNSILMPVPRIIAKYMHIKIEQLYFHAYTRLRGQVHVLK